MAFPTRSVSLVLLLIAFCVYPAAIARKVDLEEEYSVAVAAKVAKESSTERYAGLVEELGFHQAEDLSDRDDFAGFPDLEGSTEVLSEVGFPDSGESSEDLSAELGFPDLGEDTQDIFAEQLGSGFHDEESSISDVLDENGLPIGLLPSSVESYTLSGDGTFRVSLDMACYVKFDYEVYYAQTITGKLGYGTISDLSGIQAKEAFFWVPVTGIRADTSGSNYIYFDVGPISKKLPISQFEEIPVCKLKAMDSSALA